MKKITKRRFDTECALRAQRVAEFKRKATAFSQRNAALRKEFVRIVERTAKAAERASKLVEDYWDDLYILAEGTKTHPREHWPVPGVEDLVSRMYAWAAISGELTQMAARLTGREVDLVPELTKLASRK